MFIVTVTGWRGATQQQHGDLIAGALDEVHGTEVTMRHGKCPYGGVDLIADGYGRSRGWTIEPYPAEIRDGRILGSPRNRAMCAAQPRANLVLAFPGPGSRGTWDCLRWAQHYNIPFRGYPLTIQKGQPR